MVMCIEEKYFGDEINIFAAVSNILIFGTDRGGPRGIGIKRWASAAVIV